MVSYNDKPKAVTAEDLMRRYNLEEINRSKKAITTLNDNLTKTNANLEKYVEEVLEDISNLQDQVDGNISTWFFSGIPTLENSPAVDWTTEEEKANHLGDLYYDKDTGYAYRFSLENNVYSWLKLTDSDVTEALALANAAQDTADSKRRVFVTTPIPPYDVGDIWFKDNSDLYRCRASRSSGEYNEVDWIIATKYTDDTYALGVEAVLNQFKETVETNYTTKTQLETTEESILGKVESTTTNITTIVNNNYSNILDKISDYVPQETIDVLNQKVENLVTSTNNTISVVEELITNGVTQVRTENDFIFDKNGLLIDESNSKAKNQLNENGMLIVDKTGSEEKELLFAGYDEENNESIVRTYNLKTSYFSIGNNSRIEDYSIDNEPPATGVFYIG